LFARQKILIIGVSCPNVAIRRKLMTLGTNKETIVMNSWNIIAYTIYTQYHKVDWILPNTTSTQVIFPQLPLTAQAG
jgi:hypothetical protein